MLIDIVRLGNLFNIQSFLIVLMLKLCFCKRHHHIKGHEKGWHVYRQASLTGTTGADDGILLGSLSKHDVDDSKNVI